MASTDLRAPVAVAAVALGLRMFSAGGAPALVLTGVLLICLAIIAAVLTERLVSR